MFARGFKTWCENMAVGVRRDLGRQATDPLPPRELAKHLGVDVWVADQVPGVPQDALDVLLRKERECWSAITLCIDERVVAILNPTHSQAREASDLTHELAHVILGHKPGRVDVSPDGLLMLHSFDRKQEGEADWLAGCLLLPREALLLVRRDGLSDSSAARKYGVSLQMLKYRINVSGVDVQLARGRHSSSR